MACNSCNTGCNTCPQTNPCAPKCKSQITSADLAELVYIAGLDVNLCTKYSTIIDALGLTDCLGNPLGAGTAIVTCAAFQTQLCATLTAMTTGAPIAAGTVLIGKDCIAHTMPAFQAPLTVLDTSTIDLTLTGGVLSGVVIVSSDAGNIIEINTNGLYANVCTGISELPVGSVVSAGMQLVGVDCQTHPMAAFQSPLVVQDTSCIDLTLTGGVTLSATPIISGAAGNQLTCTPAGLFVQETVVPTETPITPVDTASVNLTVSGVDNHTLQADVVLSPDAGNTTVIHPNGVFTPSLCVQLAAVGGIVFPATPTDIFITNGCVPRTIPVNAGILVDDTVTVDMQITGSTITSDVNVSSVPNNLLEIRPDGLAVRCEAVNACVTDTSVIGLDTSCLNIDVNETLIGVFTVSGSPIISPNAGNVLTCTPNGLFVATNVVDIAETTPGFPLGCNGLENTANGLVAPPNSTHNYGEILIAPTGGLWLPPQSMTQGTVTLSPVLTINITNPSNCRSAFLMIDMVIPGAGLNSSKDFGNFSVSGYHSFNLPGVLVTAMSQFTGWAILGSIGGYSGSPPGDRFFYFTVPPSFVGSYSVQWSAFLEDGNATSLYVGNIGARYSLHTI